MKRIICILASIIFTISMMAQPQQGNKRPFTPEDFQKHMEAFITERACLTPDEASKFFPLLREMREAQRKIGMEQRKLQNTGKELTDEEYKIIVTNMTNMELKLRQIEQQYYTKKFPKVLSWKKILRVRGALEQYKMEALRIFSPHNGQGGPHGGQAGQQGGQQQGGQQGRRQERKGPQCE